MFTAQSQRDIFGPAAGTLDREPGRGHPFPPEAKWGFTQHNPFAAEYPTTKRSVYLPIVRGYRKTNDKDPTPTEIKSKVLQIYPIISLVRHYRDMTRGNVPESVQIGQEDVEATKLTGNFEQESLNDRVLHESSLYLSDSVPFGLAKWSVKITQEAKGEVEPRSELITMLSILFCCTICSR